ncbi:MAG: hypothetical protein GY756_05610 [bacterium]|nr:hypothetical protein [bacterium]
MELKTQRGFKYLEFKDRNNEKCTLQCSSAIGETEEEWNKPGSSFLWLGLESANPQIRVSDCEKNGIIKTKNSGWQKYVIPDDVLLTTRMHLDKQNVKDLIEKMQHWLENGTL